MAEHSTIKPLILTPFRRRPTGNAELRTDAELRGPIEGLKVAEASRAVHDGQQGSPTADGMKTVLLDAANEEKFAAFLMQPMFFDDDATITKIDEIETTETSAVVGFVEMDSENWLVYANAIATYYLELSYFQLFGRRLENIFNPATTVAPWSLEEHWIRLTRVNPEPFGYFGLVCPTAVLHLLVVVKESEEELKGFEHSTVE